jgi:hydroxymethylpyrimidine pyrophosphatase-like HAD family hydrolase
MDSPKLVASDIGGTLSVEKYVIPRFTTGVLNRLVRSGIPVALATGYNCRTTLAYANNLDERVYLLVQNGAACIHGQKILWEHFLSQETAVAVYNLLTSCGAPVFLYRGAEDDFRNYHVAAAGIEKGRNYIRVSTLSDFTKTLGISTLVPNHEVRRVKVEIEALNPGGLQVILSFGEDLSWLEVNPLPARKDLALSDLCGMIGVSMADVVYFGDNTNDLKALEAVGYPVLVENALPELKEMFTSIVGPAADEGVARYLDELFELKEAASPTLDHEQPAD